jgi:hypothetical protein
MKLNIKIWDILSVLMLIATVVVVIVVLSIFNNPTSSLNPFPPATPVPTIFIPTPTYTPVRMPPTWTPTVWVTATPHPTSTSFPTETPFTR